MHNFRYVPGAPRRRQQDRLRPDRHLDLGGGRGDVRAPLAAPVVLREKLWSYFIPTPPSAGDRPALEIALRVERLPGAAGARGDPAAPRAAHRARAWSSRRWSCSPGCCARSGARSTASTGSGLARTPASASSTRPTCPAGTTRAGSTRARCAAAGSWSCARSPDRVLDGDAVDGYDVDRDPRAGAWPRRAPGPAPEPHAGDGGAAHGLRRRRAWPAPAGWQQQQYRGLRQNALRHLIPPPPTTRRADDARTAAATTTRAPSCCAARRPRPAGACPRSSRACRCPPAPASRGARSCRARPGSRWPSTAPRASGPKAFERGDRGRRRAGAPTERILVSVFLSGGADSLTLLAPDARIRATRAARRRLALPAGAGHPARRGHAPALAPVARRASPRSTARARSRVMPAIGYDDAEPVALHEPPLLGGRRGQPVRPLGLARALPRPARRDRQPAPGPDARLGPPAGAGRAARAGRHRGASRTTTTSGRRASGARCRTRCSTRSATSASRRPATPASATRAARWPPPAPARPARAVPGRLLDARRRDLPDRRASPAGWRRSRR